jgi:hypothetical protein
MSNKEILEDLLDQFGLVQTFLFCRMETRKYEKLHLDSIQNGEVSVDQAFDYESSWWKQASIDLDNKTKHKYDERIEFIRTAS